MEVIGPEQNYSDLGIQPDLRKKLADDAATDLKAKSVVDNQMTCTKSGPMTQEQLKKIVDEIRFPTTPITKEEAQANARENPPSWF
jgi:hypothetical protein